MVKEKFFSCDFRCQNCAYTEGCLCREISQALFPAPIKVGEDVANVRLRISDNSYRQMSEYAEACGISTEMLYEATEPSDPDDDLLSKEDDIEYQVERTDFFKMGIIYEQLLDSLSDRLVIWLDGDGEGHELEVRNMLSELNWQYCMIYSSLRRVLFIQKSKSAIDTSHFVSTIIDGVTKSLDIWNDMLNVCPLMQKEISRIIVVNEQMRDDLLTQFEK